MAATQHGTAYVQGVDIDYFASAQVMSISRRQSDKLVNEVFDKSGKLVSLRSDDQRDEIDVTLRIESSFTRKDIASKVTLSASHFSGDYRVESTNETKQVKDLVELQMTLVKDEALTLT